MERQDLDALLIGALYGELTPAEESRLAAHLESHPADRGALDDLKSARQKIQESRIFAAQLEPPQAISALLLQEAHRRAPKRVAAGTQSEKESWFARFAKSFMSHPAMAAAAMLVLVLGGAGIMWMKKGDAQLATKEVSQAQGSADTWGGAAPTTAPNVDTPSAAPAGGDLERELDGKAAGSAFNAQLYESEEGGAKAADLAKAESQRGGNAPGAAADKRSRDQSITVGTVERAPKDFDKNAGADEQRNDRAATQKKVAQKPAAKGGTGGELLDGESYDDTTNAVSGAGRVGGYAQPPVQTATGTTAGPAPTSPATGTTFDVGGAGQGAGGGAATATAPRKAPAPATNAPAKETAKSKTPAKAATAAPTPDTKQTAAPPPPPAPKLDAAPAAPEPKMEAKAEPKRDESSLLSWAKAEHARAVTLAKNRDCTAAAKVALTVSNSAPGYYSQYMATDRELKSCATYINAERERDAAKSKAAAQKRATDTQ